MVADKAQDAGAVLADKAQDVGGKAADKAGDLAVSAKEKGKELGSKAADKAGEVHHPVVIRRPQLLTKNNTLEVASGTRASSLAARQQRRMERVQSPVACTCLSAQTQPGWLLSHILMPPSSLQQHFGHICRSGLMHGNDGD